MGNSNLNDKSATNQWTLIAEIVDKLMGTTMSTRIKFDDLEIDVPRVKGPDGMDLGSAKWIVNGKIVCTTTESTKE